MTTEVQATIREVTVSTNRQVGLVSDFARRMGARPRTKLLQTLVRLPDGNYGVLLMRKPRSYTDLFVRAVTPTGRGAAGFLRKLRDEWGSEAVRAR